MQRNSRGFTLVEILIVVIILGILAAIVIPQFTNASNDARTNSTASTLQTIRSQLELFRAQHQGNPPTLTALGANAAGSYWALMLCASTTVDSNVTAGTGTGYGPYLQQTPANPINKLSKASSTTTDATAGWYYTTSGSTYTLQPRDVTGNSIATY
ncbi:MAG: prepilin-type N-terminal cleavage/methylation domain-containing protein [Phycisphaerae bacterium]